MEAATEEPGVADEVAGVEEEAGVDLALLSFFFFFIMAEARSH